MATEKPRFVVSRYYEIVTEESARDGEAAERGEVFTDSPMSLEDTVRELSDCYELSSWPVRKPEDMTGYEWASTEPTQDYHDGSYRSESVHVERLGRPATGAELFRVFKLAGLIGR
jgi:hypothetical protein